MIINRNITIVMAILVLVVVAGYLVWLRGKFGGQVNQPQSVEVVASPSPEPSPSVSPSPTSEATTSTKLKTSTPSSTTR